MPKTIEKMLLHPRRVPAPTRVSLTREQCESLVESGKLTGRYELVDGEIISKMGQKRPHSFTMVLLNTWLSATFGSMRVQIQSPIDVAESDNETNDPEPDAVALRDSAADLSDKNPGPSEVALLVEVSDTSLRFDLRTKSRLYARAGIADYWVLDITARQLYVHREPSADGYRSVVVYAEEEAVAPLSKTNALVRVRELLPPAHAERTKQ